MDENENKAAAGAAKHKGPASETTGATNGSAPTGNSGRRGDDSARGAGTGNNANANANANGPRPAGNRARAGGGVVLLGGGQAQGGRQAGWGGRGSNTAEPTADASPVRLSLDDIANRLTDAGQNLIREQRARDAAMRDGDQKEASVHQRKVGDSLALIAQLEQTRALMDAAGKVDPLAALRQYFADLARAGFTDDQIIEEFNGLTEGKQRKVKGDKTLEEHLSRRIAERARNWARRDAVSDLVIALDPQQRTAEIERLRDKIIGELRPDKDDGSRRAGLMVRIHNAHGFGDYVEEQLLIQELAYVESRLITLILTDPVLSEVERIRAYMKFVEENAKLHEGQTYAWNPLYDLPGCNPNDTIKKQADAMRDSARLEQVPALVNRLINGEVKDPQELFRLLADLLTDDIHRMWAIYTAYLGTDSWHRGLTQAFRILFAGSEHGMDTVLRKIAADSDERQALEHALRNAGRMSVKELPSRDYELLKAKGFIDGDTYVVPKGFVYDPHTLADEESKRTKLDQITVTATLEMLATVVIPGAGAARIARFINNPFARLLVEQLLFTAMATGVNVAIDPTKLRDLTLEQFLKELGWNVATAGALHGVGKVSKTAEKMLLEEGKATVEKLLEKPFNQLTQAEVARLLITRGITGTVDTTLMTVIQRLQSGQPVSFEDFMHAGFTLLLLKGLGGAFGAPEDPLMKQAFGRPRDAVSKRGATGRAEEITLKRSPGGTFINPRDLEAFGMTPETAKHMQWVVDMFNMWYGAFAGISGIEIRIRPTNPDSLRWLRAGHPGKPEPIKSKTIDQRDVDGGWARKEDIGLVGYFDPMLITDEMLHGKSADVVERAGQRRKEYSDEKSMMDRLKEKHLIEVDDHGVVWDTGVSDCALDEHKNFVPLVKDPKQGGTPHENPRPKMQIAGDPDTYVILDGTGRMLTAAEAEPIIRAITELKHGALLNWEPHTDKDKDIMNKIINGHQGTVLPSGVVIPANAKAEALIVFRGRFQPRITGYHDIAQLPRDQQEKVTKLQGELVDGNNRVVTFAETLRRLVEQKEVTKPTGKTLDDLNRDIELARQALDRATVARNDTAKEISKMTGKGVDIGAFGRPEQQNQPLTPQASNGRGDGNQVTATPATPMAEQPVNPGVVVAGKKSADTTEESIWIYDSSTGAWYYYGAADVKPDTFRPENVDNGSGTGDAEQPKQVAKTVAQLTDAELEELRTKLGEELTWLQRLRTQAINEHADTDGIDKKIDENLRRREELTAEERSRRGEKTDESKQTETPQSEKQPKAKTADEVRADLAAELERLQKERSEIARNRGDTHDVDARIDENLRRREALNGKVAEPAGKAQEKPAAAPKPATFAPPIQCPWVIEKRDKQRRLDEQIRDQEKYRDELRAKGRDDEAERVQEGIDKTKARRDEGQAELDRFIPQQGKYTKPHDATPAEAKKWRDMLTGLIKEIDRKISELSKTKGNEKEIERLKKEREMHAHDKESYGYDKTKATKEPEKPVTSTPGQDPKTASKPQEQMEQPRDGETCDEWDERMRREREQKQGQQPHQPVKPTETNEQPRDGETSDEWEERMRRERGENQNQQPKQLQSRFQRTLTKVGAPLLVCCFMGAAVMGGINQVRPTYIPVESVITVNPTQPRTVVETVPTPFPVQAIPAPEQAAQHQTRPRPVRPNPTSLHGTQPVYTAGPTPPPVQRTEPTPPARPTQPTPPASAPTPPPSRPIG